MTHFKFKQRFGILLISSLLLAPSALAVFPANQAYAHTNLSSTSSSASTVSKSLGVDTNLLSKQDPSTDYAAGEEEGATAACNGYPDIPPQGQDEFFIEGFYFYYHIVSVSVAENPDTCA